MPTTIAGIKEKLDAQVGQKVLVTAQAGRKKVTQRQGILSEQSLSLSLTSVKVLLIGFLTVMPIS